MKCFKHPNAEAIGSCVSCGKGLCPDCAFVNSQKRIFCSHACNSRKLLIGWMIVFSLFLLISIFSWIPIIIFESNPSLYKREPSELAMVGLVIGTPLALISGLVWLQIVIKSKKR